MAIAVLAACSSSSPKKDAPASEPKAAQATQTPSPSAKKSPETRPRDADAGPHAKSPSVPRSQTPTTADAPLESAVLRTLKAGTKPDDELGQGGLGISSVGLSGGQGSYGLGESERSSTTEGDSQKRKIMVHPGKGTVEGALDNALVRQIMHKRLRAFRYCYERALQKNPDLTGRVDTSFTITAAGRTADVTAVGMHQEVSDCVRRLLLRMRYPKPEAGGTTSVTYPFLFTTRQGS